MARRFLTPGPIALLAALAVSSAGCGLTLDYDPPGDAGFDAPAASIDAPDLRDAFVLDTMDECGGCLDGQVCRAGACRAVCSDANPCADASVCEQCIAGACVPADIACPGGSSCLSAACDPATDRCEFVDTCAVGLACSDGGCVPGTCAVEEDCAEIVGGCGFTCSGGMCVPRVVPLCPPIFAASCEVIDPCTCLGTGSVDAALCTAGTLCDGATLLCVECVEDSDCTAASRGPRCDLRTRTCEECIHDGDCPSGRCEAGTRTCVQCLDDGDCGGSTPACDMLTNNCVGCLRDTDCDGGSRCDLMARMCVGCLGNADCDGTTPICDATSRTCRGCMSGATGECRPGERCEGGACVPSGCVTGLDCPRFACAGPATCVTTGGTGRRCVYSGANDSFCADGADCTADVCDPARAIDLTGCTHTPSAGACDDGVACTLDLCRIGSGAGDVTRCQHMPNDSVCGSIGGAGACGLSLCLALEPGAAFDATTGCGYAYEPLACGPGQYCDSTGRCLSLPGCGLGTLCPEVGSPCLDPLLCIGTQCQQISTGLGGACDLLAPCATFCGSTGCTPRTIGACSVIALP